MPVYSKIELSKIQLERAIRCFLEEDFVCAITLAGAAEEVLGVIVQRRGGESSYHSNKQLFSYMYEWMFKRTPVDDPYHRLATGVRNHLKHHSGRDEIEFDPKQEAANIIARAISNYWKVGGDTELIREFIALSEREKYPLAKA